MTPQPKRSAASGGSGVVPFPMVAPKSSRNLGPAGANRAADPPQERARIPTCVLQAYARPHSSSFREDSNAA